MRQHAKRTGSTQSDAYTIGMILGELAAAYAFEWLDSSAFDDVVVGRGGFAMLLV